jgi:hypothetical protein
MEKAFGLTRAAPGNPKTDRDTLTEAAVEVLVRRVDGESYETAVSTVAEARRAHGLRLSSESQVKDAWRTHQQDAYNRFRIGRLGRPFTVLETKRLNRMFFGKLWFCPPGADPKARMKAILGEIDRPRTKAEVAKLHRLKEAGDRTRLEAELLAQEARRENRARAIAKKIDAPFRPKNSPHTPP